MLGPRGSPASLVGVGVMVGVRVFVGVAVRAGSNVTSSGV
jgi:hypothetical protein